MAKVSLIITVLNEEKSMRALLEALRAQTRRADEVVIADGGSTDRTQLFITQFAQAHPKLRLRLIEAKGNRSVGRNAAIAHTRYEWVAITDAGCVPHRDWLEQLVAAATRKPSAQVIAGYYDAKPHTPFEEAEVPYALVMPDRVDREHFLPATRSMMIRKSVWENFGGFDPSLSDNEDYAFSLKILRFGKQIIFAEKAKVTWMPRQSIEQFYWMIYRFARGDITAGILRVKVIGVFGRYGLGLMVLSALLFAHHPLAALAVGLFGLTFYSLWAIQKNLRYAPTGWPYLPLLQLTADAGVLIGSSRGAMSWVGRKYRSITS
jgi:glycosyltransferase involved in cell wall biosynthesis